MTDNLNEALNWDDEAQAADSEYAILTPGEYLYRVERFERQRFDGSDKMAACPMALLTLSCANAQREQGTVQVRLYLNRKQAWKLTQFFKSCGLIPADMADGTSYRMPWDRVTGATGKLELSNRSYNGKEYNDVKRFIVPEAAPARSYGAL